MIRISIPWILDVAKSIDALLRINGDNTFDEIFMDVINAKNQLDRLFTQSVYAPFLRSSFANGDKLRSKLDFFANADDKKWHSKIEYHASTIQNIAKEFQITFYSEINTLPVYLAQNKGIYDVSMLIENGNRLFPPEMVQKAPETTFDAIEAGKALAFQMYTACGFHTFRVMESVAKRYWNVMTSKETPIPDTIGKMMHKLEKKFPEEKFPNEQKLISSLRQITKLHRNPCIHPEARLSETEAIGTLGIAYSAISSMLEKMEDGTESQSYPPEIDFS